MLIVGTVVVVGNRPSSSKSEETAQVQLPEQHPHFHNLQPSEKRVYLSTPPLTQQCTWLERKWSSAGRSLTSSFRFIPVPHGQGSSGRLRHGRRRRRRPFRSNFNFEFITTDELGWQMCGQMAHSSRSPCIPASLLLDGVTVTVTVTVPVGRGSF